MTAARPGVLHDDPQDSPGGLTTTVPTMSSIRVEHAQICYTLSHIAAILSESGDIHAIKEP